MMQHTVTAFDDDLADLSQRIAMMGGLAERSLGDAISALSRNDSALAERVISGDREIDRLERELEENAILTLARRQPVARDLREVMAAIKISADLERIGDLAKNIAKRALVIDTRSLAKSVIYGLEHMSETTLKQLHDVLDSYGNHNTELALEVWERDAEIDAMYTSIFRELLTYMFEDPRSITSSTHLLFAAKNIERIGDHATNIAETIHFLVTGESLNDERPKGDTTPSLGIQAVANRSDDNT